MIAKSVTAIIVSMSAAAGVVWFGTPAAADHPHKIDGSSAKETIDHMIDGKPDAEKDGKSMAESRVVVTTEAERDETVDLPRSEDKPDDAKESWMKKYLSSDNEPQIEIDVESVEARDDNPVAMTLDQDLEQRQLDKTDVSPGDKDVKVRVITKGGTTTIERIMTEIGEAGKSAERREKSVIPFEVMSDEIQIIVERLDDGMSMAEAMEGLDIKTQDGVKAVVKPERSPEAPIAMPANELFGDANLKTYKKAKPSQLLEATKLIEDDGLKDQALFSIVTYALRFDDFDAANDALGRMSESDLTSTALARIAIRHAELGDIGTALKEIEKIEDEELQDIIRVQMIETLTTPLEHRAGG